MMAEEKNEDLYLNRAVCNAAKVAEQTESLSTSSSNRKGKDSRGSFDNGKMDAIFLKDYVKSIDEIAATRIPRPTLSSFIKTSKKPITESLVHVKITHTAINHVDLLYAQGRHQNNHSGLFKPPFTLGLEFSGIVIATEDTKSLSGKTKFKPGDHVWGGGLGTHAEEIILPESAVRPVPQGWSLHDIAGLGAGTAPVSFGALVNIANIQPGETVLVHAAAGGLGVSAIQIARALGAKVIGTVGSEEKAEIIHELLKSSDGTVPSGEGVVNYSANSSWHKQVLEMTSGKGVDVVYDTVGLVSQSIRCTRFNGRIVVAGFAGRTGLGSSNDAELENVPANRILLKQIKLLGYRYGESGRRMPGETQKIWAGLTEILEREPAVMKPVIYKTYIGLHDGVKKGMKALANRKVYGKAVVEVCDVTEAERAVHKSIEQAHTVAKL